MLRSDKKAKRTDEDLGKVEAVNLADKIVEIVTKIRNDPNFVKYNKISFYSDVNLGVETAVSPIFLTPQIQNMFPGKSLKMTLYSGNQSTLDAAEVILRNETNQKILLEDPSVMGGIELMEKGPNTTKTVYLATVAPPALSTPSPGGPEPSTPSTSRSEPSTPSTSRSEPHSPSTSYSSSEPYTPGSTSEAPLTPTPSSSPRPDEVNASITASQDLRSRLTAQKEGSTSSPEEEVKVNNSP